LRFLRESTRDQHSREKTNRKAMTASLILGLSRRMFTSTISLGSGTKPLQDGQAHGEETKKEIMAVGKSLVDQNTTSGKVVVARF